MNDLFEKNSINPFDNKEFKKNFLKDKGLLNTSNSDYEVLPPNDDIDESGKIINIDPVGILNKSSRIPDSVGTIIHDASSIKTPDKIKRSEEIKSALNTIFTEYNEKYGTDLHLNLDSTSEMLANLADPVTFRTFELYNSELFGRFRAIFLTKMMQGLMLLVDDVLDPRKLLSSDTEYADKWIIIEKSFNYFMMLEQMKDSITIQGSNTELQKIGDDLKSADSEDSTDIRSNPRIKEFMKQMLENSGVK